MTTGEKKHTKQKIPGAANTNAASMREDIDWGGCPIVTHGPSEGLLTGETILLRGIKSSLLIMNFGFRRFTRLKVLVQRTNRSKTKKATRV